LIGEKRKIHRRDAEIAEKRMKNRSGQKLKMKNMATIKCVRAIQANSLCPFHFYFVLSLRPLRLCGDIFKT